MPRAPRLDIPHLLHHVIIRGIERCDIFRDDEDRRRFLDRFACLLQETSTICFAWALMRNHVHLLLMPTNQQLSSLMRRLLTGYAVVYNRKYNRAGHLFQNRYKSILCEEDPYLLELVRYIHLNPLRAGAVASVEDLDSYPWSGHGALIGKLTFPQNTAAVLSHFGKTTSAARAVYRAFIQEGINHGHREDLIGGGLRRSQPAAGVDNEIEPFDSRVLGGGGFVEQIQRMALGQDRCAVSIPIPELIHRVSVSFGIDKKQVQNPSKNRIFAQARGVVCYLAVRKLGYKGSEVGRHLHLGPTGVSLAVRRGEQACEEKPELLSCLQLD